MDWLFYLLDLGLFLLIVTALIILGVTGGLLLVNFLGARRPVLRLGFPLVTGLVAFVLGTRLGYFFIFANSTGRWLNFLIVALLFPLTAPLILEALRYSRRELQN